MPIPIDNLIADLTVMDIGSMMAPDHRTTQVVDYISTIVPTPTMPYPENQIITTHNFKYGFESVREKESPEEIAAKKAMEESRLKKAEENRCKEEEAEKERKRKEEEKARRKEEERKKKEEEKKVAELVTQMESQLDSGTQQEQILEELDQD
jgi:flagellar biosynthesis GTPase FlhF